MSEPVRTALITGASGFIGRNLVPKLTETGFTGHLLVHQTAPAQNEGFVEIREELTPDFAKAFLQKHKPTVIFHLAGITDQKNPLIHDINVGQVKIWIDAIQSTSIATRFIFMSSAAVYGEGEGKPPVKEDSELLPINLYGKTKTEAEQLVSGLIEAGGRAYSLRAFNIIGPGQENRFFLPSLCEKLLRGDHRETEVFDPTAIRDFLDVRDLVSAMILFATKTIPAGAYNLSTGTGTTIQQIAELTQKLIQSDKLSTLRFIPTSNPQSIKVSIGDNTKMIEASGWRPKFTLNESILEVLKTLE